jgi:hypothetical protein
MDQSLIVSRNITKFDAAPPSAVLNQLFIHAIGVGQYVGEVEIICAFAFVTVVWEIQCTLRHGREAPPNFIGEVAHDFVPFAIVQNVDRVVVIDLGTQAAVSAPVIGRLYGVREYKPPPNTDKLVRLFDAVQRRLAELGPRLSHKARAVQDALFAGLVFDETGTAMLPTYSIKRGGVRAGPP